jgi:hypothetical protein
MSKEMSIFKNGSSIPAHIKNMGLSETTRSLMGSTTSRKISVRGGIFRMVVGGQEVAKNEDRAMNIVIVAAAQKSSRNFYTDTYIEGVVAHPTCFSNDGVAPDKSCTTPQATVCATCPQNVAGSGQGTSRACRHSHRLAVVLENDIIGGEVYELVLAATSLFGKGEGVKMPLMQYAKLLGSHGMNITDVVTEMRFDTDSATPKLIFRAVRPLEVDELEAVSEHGMSLDAQAAIRYVPVAVAPKAEAIPLFPEPSPRPAAKPAVKTPVIEAVDLDTPEPVVRPSRTSAPQPASIDDILAEWAD